MCLSQWRDTKLHHRIIIYVPHHSCSHCVYSLLFTISCKVVFKPWLFPEIHTATSLFWPSCTVPRVTGLTRVYCNCKYSHNTYNHPPQYRCWFSGAMSQQSLNVIPVFRQCLYYYPGRQPATSYGSNTQELRLQRCMPTSLMDKIFIIRADDVIQWFLPNYITGWWCQWMRQRCSIFFY